MQVSNYSKQVNDHREKFLIVSIRQGVKEVKRILDMNQMFRNNPKIKIRWDKECCTATVIVPMGEASYAGLAVVLYDLSWSESHGYRGDPEDE